MRAVLQRLRATLWRMVRPYARGGLLPTTTPRTYVHVMVGEERWCSVVRTHRGEHGPEVVVFPPSKARP